MRVAVGDVAVGQVLARDDVLERPVVGLRAVAGGGKGPAPAVTGTVPFGDLNQVAEVFVDASGAPTAVWLRTEAQARSVVWRAAVRRYRGAGGRVGIFAHGWNGAVFAGHRVVPAEVLADWLVHRGVVGPYLLAACLAGRRYAAALAARTGYPVRFTRGLAASVVSSGRVRAAQYVVLADGSLQLGSAAGQGFEDVGVDGGTEPGERGLASHVEADGGDPDEAADDGWLAWVNPPPGPDRASAGPSGGADTPVNSARSNSSGRNPFRRWSRSSSMRSTASTLTSTSTFASTSSLRTWDIMLMTNVFGDEIAYNYVQRLDSGVDDERRGRDSPVGVDRRPWRAGAPAVRELGDAGPNGGGRGDGGSLSRLARRTGIDRSRPVVGRLLRRVANFGWQDSGQVEDRRRLLHVAIVAAQVYGEDIFTAEQLETVRLAMDVASGLGFDEPPSGWMGLDRRLALVRGQEIIAGQRPSGEDIRGLLDLWRRRAELEAVPLPSLN